MTPLNATNGDAFVWALDRSGGFVAAAEISSGGFVGGNYSGSFSVATAQGVGSKSVWISGVITYVTSGLAARTSNGGIDVFVARLRRNATGFDTMLARRYGGAGDDNMETLAIDPAGTVILAGDFRFAVNFDPAPNRSFTH